MHSLDNAVTKQHARKAASRGIGPTNPAKASSFFDRLFLVSTLDLQAFELIRRKYTDSKVVFWDSRETNERSLMETAAMARRTIVEDTIAETACAIIGHDAALLSEWDPSIAACLATSTEDNDNEIAPPYVTGDKPVLFCPLNETHVQTLAPISRLFAESRFLSSGGPHAKGAEEMMQSLNLEYCVGPAAEIARIKPSVLVLAKDWCLHAQRLIAAARKEGIPVVCLQEGPTRFDCDQRMQRCDYPLIQGAVMLRFLHQKVYFLTGNARFDGLKPAPLPAAPKAMLNCNFGKDSFERHRWLDAAASACLDAGVDFFVSRHPRDSGDIPDYPTRCSGPGVIHTHLADSSVVVTPHSSIIYEAMLMGRTVICHDPRQDRIQAFDEDQTGAFVKSQSTADLLDALKQALCPPSEQQRSRADLFLALHCGGREGKAADRCASAIEAISRRARPVTKRAFSWSFVGRPFAKGIAALRKAGNRITTTS